MPHANLISIEKPPPRNKVTPEKLRKKLLSGSGFDYLLLKSNERSLDDSAIRARFGEAENKNSTDFTLPFIAKNKFREESKSPLQKNSVSALSLLCESKSNQSLFLKDN